MFSVNLLFSSTISVEEDEMFRVTLLGTGTPALRDSRRGPSTLIEAGGEVLLFDVGRASSLRLQQVGVSLAKVDKVFLTHLRSDHIVGLSDLLLSGWVLGRKDKSLNIWGPRRTDSMMEHLTKAYAYDIHVRSRKSAKFPVEGVNSIVTEITEGVVYSNNGVTVTAFHVDHVPVEPAFGFRVDYRSHSVALSRDTVYSDSLIRKTKGVDVLIHEVAYADSMQREKPFVKEILSTHTTPAEAGRVFSQVKPKLAVYSHIVAFGKVEEAELIRETSTTYVG